MKYIYPIFLTTITFVAISCGSPAPLSTPEPASPFSTAPASETSSQFDNLAAETESVTDGEIDVSGLNIVYLRGGNLWSWTEARGPAQLTDTGDMSGIEVSNNGQLLAFMRGREIWTVGIDGTDARLHTTLTYPGAALWFAPNTTLLAVSSNEHIEIVDLSTGVKNTLVTYPIVSSGYFPEVVWMPDSSGFKTVVPLTAGGEQAEMLYVFTNGTQASLARFMMISSPESPPRFSPDGGYIIYASNSGDGLVSLFLMDSSGAARPYGNPAEVIRTFGWMPDSQHFAYGQDEPQQAFMGAVNGLPVEIKPFFQGSIRWVSDDQFLTILDGSLVLGNLRGVKKVLDSGVTEFDLLPLN